MFVCKLFETYSTECFQWVDDGKISQYFAIFSFLVCGFSTSLKDQISRHFAASAEVPPRLFSIQVYAGGAFTPAENTASAAELENFAEKQQQQQNWR